MSETFDLEAYYGKWYQIASIPTPFQQGCANSTAEYGPDDPNERGQTVITVDNTCFDTSGNVTEEISGTGTVVDANVPPKLIVQFPNIPTPPIVNYIVEETDFNSYSIVGSPDKSMLYFLARSSWVTTDKYDYMYEQAKSLGYPVDKLVIDQNTVQDSLNGWTFLIILGIILVVALLLWWSGSQKSM